MNDTDARLWHPWLRIDRVLRVMLYTRWSAGGRRPEMPECEALLRARCPAVAGVVALICSNFRSTVLGTISAGDAEHGVESSLGQATFRMLTTVPMLLQRDRVWNFLTRRRDGVALGSDGRGRRRVAFDGSMLFVCSVVFVGLVVLGSVLMLLFWAAATLPPSTLRSCPEFDLCGAPTRDGNESLSVDDPLTGVPGMTR
jgi:hypothetical protein